MTGKNVNAVVSLAKEAIAGDAEGLKSLMRAAFQEVLETEMREALARVNAGLICSGGPESFCITVERMKAPARGGLHALSRHSFERLVQLGFGSPSLGVREGVALAVHLQYMDVVCEPVEEGAGEPLGAEHPGPFLEGQIAGHDRGSPLVSLREYLEQKLIVPQAVVY